FYANNTPFNLGAISDMAPNGPNLRSLGETHVPCAAICGIAAPNDSYVWPGIFERLKLGQVSQGDPAGTCPTQLAMTPYRYSFVDVLSFIETVFKEPNDRTVELQS